MDTHSKIMVELAHVWAKILPGDINARGRNHHSILAHHMRKMVHLAELITIGHCVIHILAHVLTHLVHVLSHLVNILCHLVHILTHLVCILSHLVAVLT